MADTSTSFNNGVAVTPSDTAPNAGGAFVVGVTGNVALEGQNGVSYVYPAAVAGSLIRLNFNKVLSTGTTATGIIRFY